VLSRNFKVSDLVLNKAQLHHMTNKLASKWVGPYWIKKSDCEWSIQAWDFRWRRDTSNLECLQSSLSF